MKTAKALAVLGTTFLMGAAHAAGVSGTGTTGTGTDAAGATSTGGTNDTGPSSATGTTTNTATGTMGGTTSTSNAGKAGTSTTGTSTTGVDTFGAAGSAMETRDVQNALSSRGYDLQVDGIMGKNTRNALMRFQKDEGLTESGQIDTETLRALNIQSDRVPSSVPAMPNDSTETPVAPDTGM